MAPTYRIHKPDVLATLPQPLDNSEGRFHAGEVYTQQPGSKKRKRLEVAVGVDGEAANIYHIPSSALRTSYPIPPQESFTCPPYSIRYVRPNSSNRDQYTYFSTKDGSGLKITVCKDVFNSSGKTVSTTKSRRLQHKSPIKRLYASCHVDSDTGVESSSKDTGYADMLAVCQDGQVLCLDGAELDDKWTMSSYSLCKDLLPPSALGFNVDFVCHSPATDVLKGIFEGRQDAFGAFGHPIDSDTFNPDVLALVVRTQHHDYATRHLLLLGALTRNTPGKSQQSLVQLHVAPLPSDQGASQSPSYQLHVRSGKLFELCNDDTVRTYDLTTAVPKARETVVMPEGCSSFVQLSEHSLLSASPASLTVTNVAYRSVQAQAPLSIDASEKSSSPVLLTYLSKLDLAIAIANNTLYSIQIQRQNSSSREGLLIDAIGRGLSKADHLPVLQDPQKSKAPLNKLLSGSLSESYVRQSLVEVEALDNALAENNFRGFEQLLAAKFNVAVEDRERQPNGASHGGNEATPDWRWLERTASYPSVDRRWVLYAISRVYSLNVSDSDKDRPSLKCTLPESNVLVYLVVAGHLTVSNVMAAFRAELNEMDVSKDSVAEEIVQQLIDVDPALELLLSHLNATKLGEIELLLIIRTVVQSLDQQPRLALPMPNGTAEEDYVAMEIDQLERELELAEYNLGDDSNTRARLLTAAFERLAGYSSVATVRALRAILSPTEILSLIHLLRIQLVGNAWTTRYSELTALDQDEAAKSVPDGAIALIAELLARCIDAVGTNGWLANGSVGDQSDGGHFLTALKLEVSAALEGLNDAVALDGLLGETVRYGSASLTSTNGRGMARGADRPRKIEVAGSSQLPLGLAPNQAVSQYKVVSGGEVVERSARERGYLLSRQVQEYSLERISI